MQHSTRIGEVLLALHQAGNYKYSNWKYEFFVPPETDEAYNILLELLCHEAETMENELNVWKQEVEEARNKCYELNYFTTQQLLLLRRELAQLRSHPWQDIKPSVMHLLSSLSRITLTTVIDSVCILNIEEDDQNIYSSTEKLSPIPQALNDNPDPNSSLSIGDLTNEQLECYTSLSENWGYEDRVILSAFAELNSSDLSVLEEWCSENEKKFEKEPSGDENSSDSESESSVAESEEDLFTALSAGG